MVATRIIIGSLLLSCFLGCSRTFHPDLLSYIELDMPSSQAVEILGEPSYRYTKDKTDYYIYTYQSPAPLAQDELRRENSLRMDTYRRDDLISIRQYAIAVRSNAVVHIEALSTTDSDR